jgi:hypothetical protein
VKDDKLQGRIHVLRWHTCAATDTPWAHLQRERGRDYSVVLGNRRACMGRASALYGTQCMCALMRWSCGFLRHLSRQLMANGDCWPRDPAPAILRPCSSATTGKPSAAFASSSSSAPSGHDPSLNPCHPSLQLGTCCKTWGRSSGTDWRLTWLTNCQLLLQRTRRCRCQQPLEAEQQQRAPCSSEPSAMC